MTCESSVFIFEPKNARRRRTEATANPNGISVSGNGILRPETKPPKRRGAPPEKIPGDLPGRPAQDCAEAVAWAREQPPSCNAVRRSASRR